ncbi:7328_t:CDS:2, partial [Racocetra fulgida]
TVTVTRKKAEQTLIGPSKKKQEQSNEKKSTTREGTSKKETKPPATTITSNKGKSKALQVKKTTTKKAEEKKAPQYQPSLVEKAAILYPDNYWRFHAESNTGMINYINEEHQLELINVDVRDQGPITGMTLSPDGAMLVTFCNVGCAKIWDTADFKLIQKLRDTEEINIDEFFVGKFIPDHTRMAIGGKLKDRHHWSKDDDDNHILPCPLKPMVDGLTCMAFTVSFVPNTANRYFMAATDEHVRLYDFDAAQLMQTFSDNMYSQYCDCGKFIHPLEPLEDQEINDDSVEECNSKSKKKQIPPKFAYFITRGVEILDAEGGKIGD